MTTTAATTSASPSTSNDYPIQDNNGASNSAIEHHNNNTINTQQQSSINNTKQAQQQQQQSATNTNTEQKRPMNAFLLFCKRQRSLVREKHPNLENRGITKILGDSWSKLDKEQKSKYTDLARQHKEAFMKAHPDFKWCKTPMSNNNNHSNASNSNSNDCYATNIRNTEPLPPTHSADVVQSNNRDNNNLTNRQQQNNHHLQNQQQQQEAPKPPKKRFLERNDSIYTKFKSQSATIHNESTPLEKDGTYISNQSILDRVIDKAFSDKSNDSPSGINECKRSNRNLNHLTTSSVGVTPTSFSTPTTTSTISSSSTSSSSSSYSSNADEPVDFSMNRTINTTKQQIINNLVEKMLSGPTDIISNTSKMNGTDSQLGPSVKRDNPEDT